MIVRKGRLIVPEDGHAGDNRLGGRKFDRELLTYVLGELGKKYSLSEFSESNRAYMAAWGRLTLAVEEAKIELSRREEAVVEIDGMLCRDDHGKPVQVEVPINRKLYEKLIGPDIEKAVHICQTLLDENRLSTSDMTRMILVGGPTKTPFIQQALAERLKIEIDTSVDPMIAVALGAAIYARTVETPSEIQEQIDAIHLENESPIGEVTIQLKHQNTSNLPEHFVIGKVEGPAVGEGGLTVEISRTDGGWSSGRLPISDTGVFSTNVLLVDNGRPHESRFRTVVMDAAGNTLALLDQPEIWYPYPGGGEVKPRLANSLRVGETDNKTTVLLQQGTNLPAQGNGASSRRRRFEKEAGMTCSASQSWRP